MNTVSMTPLMASLVDPVRLWMSPLVSTVSMLLAARQLVLSILVPADVFGLLLRRIDFTLHGTLPVRLPAALKDVV